MSTVKETTTTGGGLQLEEELRSVVSERTLEILEMRRRRVKVRRRGWVVRRTLLAADVVGLLLALALGEWIGGAGTGSLTPWNEVIAFVLTLPVWIVVAKLHGLYEDDEERTDHSTADDFTRVFHMVTFCTWGFTIGCYVTGLAHPIPAKLIVFWAAAILLVTLGRVAARGAARRHIAYLQNTLIVGAGEVGQLIARKLLQHPEYGLNLVGFVDDAPTERRWDLEDLGLLGGLEDTVALAGALDVERVIIAFSNQHHEQTLELIRTLRPLGVQIDLVPRLFEAVGPSFDIHAVEGLPLFGLPPGRIPRSSRLIKRTADLASALAVLLLTAPLFAYAAWRIKRESPGPVFFRQARLGMDMKEFTALKFRTMKVDTDEAPHRAYIEQTMSSNGTPADAGLYKLDRSDVVTPFGRWLRNTSLDELPQLINVLRGDMSLVGPRPCLRYETEHFAPHHFERFQVPAGMTGLWQVTARAHATFGEALDMDVAYARSWSLGLDVTLLFKTPLQLVRPHGTH